MRKWIVGTICVVLAFAAAAVAEEKADEGMISSGNILLLINGSPNFAAGYGSLKVEPDEGDSQEGNVLMFSAGGRLGFFIQKSFAFGAFGSLAYAKAESETAIPGVEASFEDLSLSRLSPWARGLDTSSI